MKPFPIFVAIAAVALVVAHYLIFVVVPMEVRMGPVQRIFYFHVPSAMMCYLGFVLCFFGSLGYLFKRKTKMDLFALAGAEVGLLFGFVVLVSGPIWARIEWGTWWKWEPRLTSMLLLVLIFAAYWVLRTYGGRGEGVRRFAAVLAIFGTPNILFVRSAVKKWRGDHPDNVVDTLDPDMKGTFYACMLILLLLFSLLMILRYRMHRDARTAQAIRRRLGRLGGL